MKSHRTTWAINVALGAALLVVLTMELSLSADDPPAAGGAGWTLTTVEGKSLDVGASDKPMLLLFVMADQARSKEVAEKVVAALKEYPGVTPVAVVSGAESTRAAKAMAGSWPGQVATDDDYKLAGRLKVHVWPTTVVLMPKGELLGHLAGVPGGYEKDLGAYLEYAAGKIDAAALKEKLGGAVVIADDPAQMAQRHLQVAERLMDKGLVAQARDELKRGLARQADNVALQLALARVYLLLNEPRETMAMLDRIEPASVPSWRVQTVRGRALVALGEWERASAVLIGAIRLNPEPAEAYYALGQVYEHQGDLAKAAAAYRSAFETTVTGRKLLGAGVPPAATQP